MVSKATIQVLCCDTKAATDNVWTDEGGGGQ